MNQYIYRQIVFSVCLLYRIRATQSIWFLKKRMWNCCWVRSLTVTILQNKLIQSNSLCPKKSGANGVRGKDIIEVEGSGNGACANPNASRKLDFSSSSALPSSPDSKIRIPLQRKRQQWNQQVNSNGNDSMIDDFQTFKKQNHSLYLPLC